MSFYSVNGLSRDDERLFNLFGRGKPVAVPFPTVHQFFEDVVDRHPDAIAVQDARGCTISYKELERRANVLTNRLTTMQGLRPRQRVCLVMSRSIEMMIAIMAVLKAGCQYVPLDGGVVTEESLSYILQDIAAGCCLCLGKFKEKVYRNTPKGSSIPVIALDDDEYNEWKGEDRRPNVHTSADDGAYIIFTSGTTSKPKGVDVSHRGVTNTLGLAPSSLGATVGRNIGQVLSVSFDMGRSSQSMQTMI